MSKYGVFFSSICCVQDSDWHIPLAVIFRAIVFHLFLNSKEIQRYQQKNGSKWLWLANINFTVNSEHNFSCFIEERELKQQNDFSLFKSIPRDPGFRPLYRKPDKIIPQWSVNIFHSYCKQIFIYRCKKSKSCFCRVFHQSCLQLWFCMSCFSYFY